MGNQFFKNGRARQGIYGKRLGWFGLFSLFFLTGCGGRISEVPLLHEASKTYGLMAWKPDIKQVNYPYLDEKEAFVPDVPFLTEKLCVLDDENPYVSEYLAKEDPYASEDLSAQMDNTAAFLFNISTGEIVYSKNCNQSIYPASTTKLLTALVALKYGNLADMVTIAETNGGITIPGAQLCGFREGEQMTLETLVNSLLIFSGNDAGIAIAQHISGSVEEFVKLMNQEAKAIGATHSNFVNPHGLHKPEHKTTAYDLYLIFMECLKYEEFFSMIYQSNYTAQFLSPYPEAEEPADAAGTDISQENSAKNTNATEIDASKEDFTKNTNAAETDASQGDPAKNTNAAETDSSAYFSREIVFPSTMSAWIEKMKIPDGVTVYGGKTGSTPYAGACLLLLSSREGEYYISGIFKAKGWTELYAQMEALLELEKSLK